MDANTADIVTSMAYETQFGLYDHDVDADENPLALVTLHENEKYDEVSGVYAQIKRFRSQNIAERHGLSLTEYMDLPPYVQTMMSMQFTKEVEEREKVGEQLKRESEKNDANDKAMEPIREQE